MTARGAFTLAAAAAAAVLLFLVVVRPAVERGGFAEPILIAVAFALVLLAERWLRGR